MKDFAGRTAVVTGGGSGIGRGIARSLARRGMNVVVSDVESDAAQETASDLEQFAVTAIAVATDVADFESVSELAEVSRTRFGDIHILVNNAGVSVARRGIDATYEDWQWVLGVNLWGVVHGIQAFLPGMLAAGHEGHIVNTASMNGLFPSSYSAMYSTSKYGVIGLTDTLRNELRDTPISITALCPAGVVSRIMDAARNRPAELTAPTPPPPHVKSSELDLSPALEPDQVGELVVRGIERDQLYVFTDPKNQLTIQERHDRMMGEFAHLAEWIASGSPSSPGA